MSPRNDILLTRDETFRVVCSLRTSGPSGTRIGSGIFAARSPDELYLITAAHVAKHTGLATEVVMADASGNPTTLKLAALNSLLAWRVHRVADLAVLPIQLSSRVVPHMADRFFPLSQFQLCSVPISRDWELTTVGFPHGLGAAGRFSPITHRSYASSSLISFNRFDTNTASEFFLLENQALAAYGGGPVFDLGYVAIGGFKTSQSRTTCHGIIHGPISDVSSGKLAAVTPAYYLAQMF